MSYIVKTIGEKVSLGVLLTQNGNPVSGESPTVEIRRNVDGWYLDFGAVAPPYWKTAGGQREKLLPEKSWATGFYTWTFDHSVYDNTKNDYTIIYRNVAPFRLYEIEIVSFNNEMSFDIEFIRKLLANKQTLESLTPQQMKHTVFDDDKSSIIYEADITLSGSGSVETREPL